jgi:hypothetical protein
MVAIQSDRLLVAASEEGGAAAKKCRDDEEEGSHGARICTIPGAERV